MSPRILIAVFLFVFAISRSSLRSEDPGSNKLAPLIIRAGTMIHLGKLEQLEKALLADPTLVHNPNAVHGQLMHYAAYCGNVDAVKLLLKHGGSLEQLNEEYKSPLHVAAFWNRVDVLEVMLEHGVDVDSRGTGQPEGLTVTRSAAAHTTALCQAASGGAEEAVRLLLDKGAKWDANPPELRHTAIHMAMSGRWKHRQETIEDWLTIDPNAGPLPAVGNVVVIDMLIEAGADLRSRSCEGNEPIHIAAGGLHLEELQFLMEKYKDRIDLNAPNRFGKTPLTLAMKRTRLGEDWKKVYQPTIDLLKKHGAVETPTVQTRIP